MIKKNSFFFLLVTFFRPHICHVSWAIYGNSGAAHREFRQIFRYYSLTPGCKSFSCSFLRFLSCLKTRSKTYTSLFCLRHSSIFSQKCSRITLKNGKRNWKSLIFCFNFCKYLKSDIFIGQKCTYSGILP